MKAVSSNSRIEAWEDPSRKRLERAASSAVLVGKMILAYCFVLWGCVERSEGELTVTRTKVVEMKRKVVSCMIA